MRRRRGCSTGLAIISPSRRGTEPTLKRFRCVTRHVTPNGPTASDASIYLAVFHPFHDSWQASDYPGCPILDDSILSQGWRPVAIWILQRRIPVCFLITGCRDQHGRRLFLGSSRNGILLRAGGWFLVNAAPGPLELNLCSDGPRWTSDISCFARQYSTVFSASQRLVQASKRLMSYESVSSDSTLPRHLELCLVGPPYFHYHNEVR